MVRPDVMTRLASGERLLMDGAMGSELHRRGVEVAKGSDSGGPGPWSANANIDAPDKVRQVHEDYLREGADINLSNNFWTSRPRLAAVGQEDNWEAITRTAAEIAVQARDAVNPSAYVAGAIAPPGSGDPDREYREFVDQSRILAEAGVDVMLPEFCLSVQDCVTAVDACATTGLPVWLGFAPKMEGGKMWGGETVEELVAALEGRNVDVMFAMCAPPEHVSDALRQLRPIWDGPIGGYSTINYGHATHFGPWTTYDTDRDYDIEQYVDFAREWLDIGAQIVGGCCATDPEYIAALRPIVKGS